MNERRKSDDRVVPEILPNNPGEPGAEVVEGRRSAKGNAAGETRPGRSAGLGVSSDLDRVRQVARRDKDVRFTALLHHVTVERLEAAFRAIRPGAAPGVDGVTWQEYGQELEGNLRDLHARVHRGAYRAKPSRRAFIPKPDGRLRPLGVAALEDKILQRAVAEVLDADIRDYFSSLDHSWLVKFLEHRIADKRVLRLIQRWLKAGVIEDGVWAETLEGTPQGASISTLLSNVFLHSVFDQWVHQWRQRHARGDVVVVRFADDFVVGFQRRDDAEQFWADLRERFARFGLELHEGKTRLIEFGRYAAENRESCGLPKPETFDFLGLTHICAKDRRGRFRLQRVTSKKKMCAKLHEVKAELRRRMHLPIPEQGAWLARVVRGHYTYYAVPDNGRALNAFRLLVTRLWLQALRRRSQRDNMT